MSTVHFSVTAQLPEARAYAVGRGWLEQGYPHLSIEWQELHWSADGWKTTSVLRSSDVPCPVVNGYFLLQGVAPGTEVEFAVHVGVACHAAHDTAGVREVGDFWMNNAGTNYRQKTR